jgi:hypothetical protein
VLPGFGCAGDSPPPLPDPVPPTAGSELPADGKVTPGTVGRGAGGLGAGGVVTDGTVTVGTVTVGTLTEGTVIGGGGSGGTSAPADVTQPANSPPHMSTSRATLRLSSDITSYN